MPTSFAAEIQNPNEAPGQTIVMAGMKGSIGDSTVTGAANTTTGQGCNQDEVCRSFSKFLFGKCHSVTTITPNYPNMPFGGPAGLIKPGQVGTLKIQYSWRRRTDYHTTKQQRMVRHSLAELYPHQQRQTRLVTQVQSQKPDREEGLCARIKIALPHGRASETITVSLCGCCKLISHPWPPTSAFLL